MGRQEFFVNLQQRLEARALWGWTTLLNEIHQVEMPSEFDFPEPYEWCSGTDLV